MSNSQILLSYIGRGSKCAWNRENNLILPMRVQAQLFITYNLDSRPLITRQAGSPPDHGTAENTGLRN